MTGEADAFSIRAGVPADAAVLSAFAQRVFRQTFENDPSHRPSDMAMFLAEALGPETLARELADPRTPYELAESGGRLIGYIKLCAGEAPECVSGRRALEIARLYVDFDWHKRGAAHALMERALTYAANLRCDALWLGVWHRNVRAQRFYRKWGFEPVGEHPFVFGTDHQTDLVFARPLAPGEPGRPARLTDC